MSNLDAPVFAYTDCSWWLVSAGGCVVMLTPGNTYLNRSISISSSYWLENTAVL